MDFDYSNSTSLEWEEIEPFNPYDFKLSLFESIFYFVQRYLICIVKIILCIFVFANNTLLAYVILKFKRLQTKTNYIILNLAVANLGFSIISTILSLVESFWYYNLYSNTLLYAIITTTTYMFVEISHLLALLLGFDWFILGNFKSIMPIYQKFHKWLIAAAYLIPFGKLFIIFVLYQYHHEKISVSSVFVFIVYCISIIVIVIINVTKYRGTYVDESLKTIYALYVANVYFLLWLPLFLMLLIYLLITTSSTNVPYYVVIILALLTYILEIAAFAAPIVIVVMLGKLDKHFKMSYDIIFKKSVRNYMQADDNENIDDDDPFV